MGKAEKLASREYDLETFRDTLSNGDVVILVKHPELPGCMAHGATLAEALASLREARTEYIYTLLLDDLSVPYPRSQATITAVNSDFIGFEQRESVGFGAKSTLKLDSDSQEKDITFSFGGDLDKK